MKTMTILKNTYSVFIFSLILSFFKLQGQTCSQYTYLCSNNSMSNFTKYDNIISFPAVINGNTCVRGTPSNAICGPVNLENQTWILAKVINPSSDSLYLKYSHSGGQNISISIFGTYPNISTEMCSYLENFPNTCKEHTNNSGIFIPNVYPNAYFYICVLNQSNALGDITLFAENTNIEFYHFTPTTDPNCQKPTMKITDEDVLIREEEKYLWRANAKFTGEPPFYYTFLNGHHELTATTKEELIPNYYYSDKSFDIRMGTVRNACGYGTIDPTLMNYLVYDKDTSLVACIPFNNDFENKRNGLKFRYTSGNFTSDRNGEANAAVEFDGQKQYLKYPGRDLKGENYVISLWIKPSPSTQSIQTIFSIGGDLLRQNQLRLNQISNGNYRFEYDYYSRNGTYNLVVIPAQINTWIHITILKTANKLIIKDNLGHSNDITFDNFDVPLIGTKSFLWFASNPQQTNYFKGAIDHFKYFSGGLPENILQDLPHDAGCELKLCEEIPIVTLPGYRIVPAGSSLTMINIKIDSKPNDIYKVQKGDHLPGYWKNTFTNSFDFYFFGLKNEYKLPKTISNNCGTAVYIDTLAIVENSVLKYCFNFNGHATEFTNQYIINSNTSTFGPDRFYETNKAISYTDQSKIRVISPRIEQNNYSVAFWFKPSFDMIVGENYQIYEYNFGVMDKLNIKKNSDNGYTLSFEKYGPTNSKTFNLPNISNTWTHFAIVYQAGNTYATGNLRIYINNEEKLNILMNGIDSYVNGSSFVIGSYFNANIKSFNGYLDDFKIYDGGLGKDQISLLFDQNSECFALICNDSLKLKLELENKVIEYGNPLNLKTSLLNAGPAHVSWHQNDFVQANFSIDKKNAVVPITGIYHLKTGENTLKYFNISNHCYQNTDSLTIKAYLKPKLIECLNFDSPVLAPNSPETNLSIQNLITTTDRNEMVSKAIYFSSTSALNLNIPLTHLYDNSFSFWIKIPASAPNTMPLIFMGNQNSNYQIKLQKEFGHYKLIGERNSTISSLIPYKSAATNAEITPNSWYHIAVTFEASGLTLYINGQQKVKIDEQRNYFYNLNVLNSGNLSLRIGSNLDNTQKMEAYFDDFKLFEGGLNEFEVKQQMLTTGCGFEICPKSISIPELISTKSKYFGGNLLKSNAKVNTNSIFFSEHQILLEPGFQTSNNSVFKAEIKNCNAIINP